MNKQDLKERALNALKWAEDEKQKEMENFANEAISILSKYGMSENIKKVFEKEWYVVFEIDSILIGVKKEFWHDDGEIVFCYVLPCVKCDTLCDVGWFDHNYNFSLVNLGREIKKYEDKEVLCKECTSKTGKDVVEF